PPPTSALSLHDALPISGEPGTDHRDHVILALAGTDKLVLVLPDPPLLLDRSIRDPGVELQRHFTTAVTLVGACAVTGGCGLGSADRKSTRLNSSHDQIS